MRNLITGVDSFNYVYRLMFIGGCAGSTTCGIKIFRFQYFIHLFESANYLSKGIFVLKYKKSVDNKFIGSIISFLYI